MCRSKEETVADVGFAQEEDEEVFNFFQRKHIKL